MTDPNTELLKHRPAIEREARAATILRGENADLREALWECVKLSGADVSDGPPRPGTSDWPQIAALAIREVQELRDSYDEACKQIEFLERGHRLRDE